MKRLILASILLIIQPSFSQKLIDLKGLKEKLETEVPNRSPQKNILTKIQIGTIYESNGFYSNALMYYNQILNCYKSKEKDSLYVIVNNKIGSIYNTTKQYKNALSFLTEASIISEKLNYKIGLANALNLMGANYEKQGDYLKALQFENKSLGYLSPKLHKFETANVYENIGSIYEDLLQFDKASSYYQKAYSFFKGTETKEEANILNNLADIHRKKNELNTAIQITGQSLNLAKKINDNHLQESAYKDFAKVYALKEDYKKAYVFRIEAEKFKEKALINENKNQINLLLTDFEIDRKESQIKILEEQAKSGKTQFLLLFILAGSTIIIMLLVYWSIRKKRIANLKIRNYEQQQLQAELNQKWIEEKNMQKNLELKTATLSNYSLHIAQKNKILADLSFKLKSIASRKTINHESLIKDLYSEIDFTLQQENEWQDFNIFFEEIHPNYIKNLSSAAIEDLSPTELKLGILLRLNMSSKEIASILRVTPDSVRVARHRFRKKLPIDSKKELVNFLLEL
ncbi:tetratricopeptide repeat protein [Flavobacterium amniphilum]|uniref:tetratricopeptide repeat protein n=1 Tax=Flavobacterium amniphilum TaxID=1834035 RepID=UPI00202A095A|nr:tetratricopeptide repeat protein [Flavobacterium amniphilum]MCL9804282.1 tetratricopeptide repeat protein [Flavobacterium amniphilum]